MSYSLGGVTSDNNANWTHNFVAEDFAALAGENPPRTRNHPVKSGQITMDIDKYIIAACPHSTGRGDARTELDTHPILAQRCASVEHARTTLSEHWEYSISSHAEIIGLTDNGSIWVNVYNAWSAL